MFVESPRRSGDGWMHWLEAPTNGQAVRRNGYEKPPRIIDLQWLAEAYRKAATNAMIATLAKSLGVPFNSLLAFNTGWDGETTTTPMRNAHLKIVGIQRRWPDGTKRCVTGSKGGLFIPNDLNGESPLFVVEGASDSEALHGAGLPVLGVYNAGANGKEVIVLAAGRPIVIVADNDKRMPRGWIGGRIRTARLCKELKAAGLAVRIIHPPRQFKDARDWIRNGATRETIEAMIPK